MVALPEKGTYKVKDTLEKSIKTSSIHQGSDYCALQFATRLALFWAESAPTSFFLRQCYSR
jgi:hypothetical protein